MPEGRRVAYNLAKVLIAILGDALLPHIFWHWPVTGRMSLLSGRDKHSAGRRTTSALQSSVHERPNPDVHRQHVLHEFLRPASGWPHANQMVVSMSLLLSGGHRPSPPSRNAKGRPPTCFGRPHKLERVWHRLNGSLSSLENGRACF